jgi:hypothetical protein
MSQPLDSALVSLECANPACRRRLSSPREGEILEFEIVSIAVAASDDEPNSWDESPKREARRVYLCLDCARSVSIQIGAEGISIQPGSHPE